MRLLSVLLAPIFILISTAFTACHSEPERPEPPETPNRPGQGSVEHTVHFSAANPAELVVGETKEDIHLILYRENATDAPEESYEAECIGGGKTLTVAGKLVFGAGEQESKLRLTLNPGHLRPGESIEATIAIQGTEATHRLIVVAPAFDTPPQEGVRGHYICPDRTVEVLITCVEVEGKRWYTAEGEGLRRSFAVDADGGVELLPLGGVVDAASLGDMRIEPSYSVRSEYYADEGLYVFNAAEPDTQRDGAPHREYLQVEGQSGWSLPVKAVFTDGWLVEHVQTAWGGPWVPSEVPWTVMVQTREDGGTRKIRILDPYCGDSPLAIVNAARAGTCIEIVLDNEGGASIAEQDIPFLNKDVFDFTFRIAAPEGRLTDGIISFERPLHNCDMDRESPTTDRTWATLRPVVLDISQSSISDI